MQTRLTKQEMVVHSVLLNYANYVVNYTLTTPSRIITKQLYYKFMLMDQEITN